ncbi:MAG: helix-turn-helix transcriptional regulator [Micavibrio sp.]
MLTHANIWHAIDRLAASFGYSTSGLARQAGLAPTSFNKSKRCGEDGKPRWPSTESIARILESTGATMGDFLSLMDAEGQDSAAPATAIPLLGFAQAGAYGYFDEDGYPAGDAWDEIRFPENDGTGEGATYALEISGDSMEPLYRKGDILVLSRTASLRRGDRIVVRTVAGEVMAKELVRKTAGKIELQSLNPAHENRVIPTNDISWMARILWVSQ